MFKKSFVRCILIVTIVAAFLIVGCSSSGATTSQPVSEQKVEAAEPEKAEVAKTIEEVTEPEVKVETEEPKPEVASVKDEDTALDEWINSLELTGFNVLLWNYETGTQTVIENEEKYLYEEGDKLIIFNSEGIDKDKIVMRIFYIIPKSTESKSENYTIFDFNVSNPDASISICYDQYVIGCYFTTE